MAQRLRMTNADYVAIAVSPALIMALVGSLVFFLIEVLYVGGYGIRLNYIFALFVFATVLIARIAIEFGSERAAMYSLPLGLLVYVALMRFVEHQSSLSWLINLVLLAVVWWCAHKLTWDCTVIDDNEDASGEGLLGRVGLDAVDEGPNTASAVSDNELFDEGSEAGGKRVPWWRRLFLARQGPHTPGLWVLYFSVAALPLFGIGQRWIPSGDVGRRRYAFGLLAVYVAAALCLLVTTSFLGLRRYLRQRRVEMPAPMAVTWVSLGGVLILLVMFVAALIPRPNAEYEISQAPWQAAAPGELSASQHSVGNEGTNDPDATNRVTTDDEQAPPGEETGGEQDPATSNESAGDQPARESGSQDEANQESSGAAGDQSSNASGDPPSQQSDNQPSGEGETGKAFEPSDQPSETSKSDNNSQQEPPASSDEQSGADGAEEQGDAPADGSSMRQMFEHSPSLSPSQLLQSVTSSLGNILKLVFYVLLAAAIVYFAWTRREAIGRALSEILRQLRDYLSRLFGGGAAAAAGADEANAAASARRRTFAEFTDPFASGRHRNIPPVELVRYTFDAFEAWAGDRGRQRTPDQTPQELVRSVLPPQTPMYDQARRLAQLYSEAAYSAATISREAASSLQSIWQMMRAAGSSPPRGEVR